MKALSYTFAGGVLAPGLWGRVDLNKYQTGLKRAHNMIIGVEGGVYKRFGSYLVGKRKFQDSAAKLIPWRIANDDSYMLEFGDLYVRFIRLGGQVSIPGGHVHHADNVAANVGGYMEVETPYSAAEVNELKFTFANDIMYIYHGNHQTRQLRRLGLYDWALDLQSFDPHPAWSGGGSAVFTNGALPEDSYVAASIPHEYKVSATLADGIETKPSSVISVNADLGWRRNYVTISWSAVAGATQYTVYKGKNGIFGFIGYTTSLSYQDRNYAPSYDVVPVGTPLEFPAGEWPRVGEFYKQRMAYAAPESEPQGLWLSRPLIFNSLTDSIPIQDDDAIKATLVGRQRHTINHMLQLKKFIIFTDTAEWILGTVNNDSLTAASIDPIPETAYGSDPLLRPLAIGERILFVQNITGSIRDMGYEYTADSFKADDLSRLARHLFKNKRITAWDYAAFPQNLVQCITSDGGCQTLTYVREHEIWGWTSSSTKGKFLDFAAVSELDHDGAYFQVERVIDGVKTYFIERTEINFSDRIEDMVYLDCALTYRSELPFTALTEVTSTSVTFTVVDHDYIEGTEVHLEIEIPNLDEPEGPPTYETYRVVITAVDGDDLEADIIREGAIPLTGLGDTIGTAFRCATTISGLDHLEGETVRILADGFVVSNLTVASGEVNLPFAAARVHVGFPYSAEVVTLDLDTQGAEGTYTLRTVDDIMVRLENSRGVLGGASNSPRDLRTIEPRNDEGYYEPNTPLNGAYRIPSHVAWGYTCGVMFRSVDPLPMNILNIVPELIYGA